MTELTLDVIERVLEPLSKLSLLASHDETARAVRAFAARCRRLDSAASVVARAAAADRVAELLPGSDAEQIVDAALGTRPNGHPRVAPNAAGDELPPGVDPHTDTAQAHRIVREHGRDLRHCQPLGGFLVWGGRVWGVDAAAAQRRAMDTAIALMRFGAQLLEQARDRGVQDVAQALIGWARRAQSEPSIRRALDLARCLPPIACEPDVWDRDPWLLACVSGTLDLRTGEMRPHRREDMITRLAADPRSEVRA